MKNTYTIRMAMFIMVCLAIFIPASSQPVCSNYMQHYWKFEENALVFKDSAGVLDATATISTSRITGKVGFGQSFNGLSEINIPDDNAFDWSASSSFTIEFWVNKSSVCPANTTANNNVIIGRDDASTSLHWWVGISCTNPGKVSFNLISNGGSASAVESKTGIIDGNWHHVVIVRDGSLSKSSIYIDGIRDTTITFTYPDGFSSNVPINVGWLNLSTKFHFNGFLDELAVYNTALPAGDITDHYNSGNGKTYCVQQVSQNNILKILPLGNSITYDNYSNDQRPVGQRISYRLELFNKLQQAGYKFNFVGSEISGQDLLPDPENGGFPGINKEQMVTLLQTGYNPRTSTQVTPGNYLDLYQPDIILLHIGTNDLTTDITAINQILDIVDTYRTQSGKTVKLVIAKIINRMTYSSATTQYNTNLANAVAAKNNADNILVDMENGAGINYSTDMIDNLHPNNTGYGKMANLWYTTLASVLGTPPAQTIPSTPAGLIAQAASSTSVQLNWSENATNETGYKIERKTTGGSFSQIAQIAANASSYTDNNLNSLTTYTYRVYAYNASGNSSFSNESTTQTPALPGQVSNLAPGKPSVQSATAYGGVASRGNDNNTNGSFFAGSVTNTGNTMTPYWQVDLQAVYSLTDVEIWNRTDCCGDRMANFYLFVSDNPFTSADPIATVNQAGVWSSLNATYPNPSKTINVNRSGRYVRVQLANQGELSIAEVKVFGTSGSLPPVPAAPTNLTTQALSTTSIQLGWTDNATDESGYRVERKTGGGSFAQVAQLAAGANSYTDNNLTPATSYTYRVYAFNNGGSSGFSNESTAQTQSDPGGISNLAPGKPSVQSATAYGGVASRGNDNNTNGSFFAGSVTNTGNTMTPYWQVDLQAVYSLTDVEIWNRTDCCGDRMANFYLFVSDNPFTSADPLATVNQAGVWSSFNADYPNPSKTINVNRSGRYVRVQLANQGELSMAEMKVFGTSGSLPPAPAAPTNLTTQALSTTSIQLGWSDNATDESGYRVERKTGGGSFAQLAQLAAGANSYTDNNLTPATSYTYRVYAFNNGGSSGFSNESTAQTQSDPGGISNLAPGKPSVQSATAYGGVASRGNDSNTNGSFFAGSVTNTGNTMTPYWQVDLQAVYSLTDVEVWNRTDCCGDRMANFYLFVSDNPFTSADPIASVNQAGVWSSLNATYPNPSKTINVNRSGRYVRVQLANQGELSIAEVKVFGLALKSTRETEHLNEAALSVYPNPAYGEISLSIRTSAQTKVFIGIYDLSGRLIHVVEDASLSEGEHEYMWNAPASGVYLAKMIAGQKTEIVKILVNK